MSHTYAFYENEVRSLLRAYVHSALSTVKSDHWICLVIRYAWLLDTLSDELALGH